ncbi:7TM diverse intracellular signaling domain-containing protein [Pseudomonas sp. MWU16-30317]|uniref:hybrid sensor histidine kinase/response regulator n=1 Tax=Pseudomonas sp. MWU16-30317 TaxID=2878095 RepID=UPI001CF9C8D4|nr:7TM diverse intracellular signaling domain-containing protein [Pseudomonas sp. MWU16-30317]
MRYLLILLFTWLPMLASAVDFDESTRSLPLGRTMQVLEDSSGEATIDEVSAPEAQARFHRNTDEVLNAGYSKSAFWIRLDLRYTPRQSGVARNWLLELAYPPMDHVELYQADADGHFYRSQVTGDTLPYSNRVIRQNNFVFDIPFVPQQAQTLYLRVQSEGSVQVPLTLWSSNAYLEAQPERLYVLGMIYGVLLGMLVYNLFIYLSVRDTSYLYYILYIASFGLYQVSVNGAGVEFLWPENPWWANAATPLLIGAAAFFGCQFSRSFLQTREHSRVFDWLLKGLMVYGLVVMVMSLGASYGLALRLATLLALLFTVVIFSAGVKAWWRGQRQARYFMIAWTAFLAGGVVNTLMVLGYLPNIFITMYSSQLGSALEVGLLSLALADRINAMREEQSRILVEAGHKLELLNQQLSNSNRLKDEFLATVTHELRTPMNGVIGSLELMQTVPMNIELEQYQQTAATSARDMMRMVDDILILTELQAGKLYPRHEPFRLQGLLDGVHLQFARQAHNKGLAFALDILSILPDKLVGDSRKLALCLSCLLDNAVKFTRQGVVRLQVLGEVDDENNLALTFKIIDTGIGFSYLDEDTLYQRFYQVDSSMTREYGGLGIGLAICRQLAELIGGQLHHQSEPGRGSCFTLTVKLAVVEPLPMHTTISRKLPESTRRSAHDCTLLLIDDNSVNQLVLRGMLLKLGYRVRTADCANAAIEQMQSENFDAVLLDCHSPMTDGAVVCARLREVPRTKDIPVLGIVASLERSDRDRYLAAGMTECMHRPVRFEELQSLLHSWLLAHKQSEQVGG